MMRNIRLVNLTFIIITAFPLVISAIGIDVPATDPVYDFLKRLETRGIIKGFNDLTLPLTRDEIVNFLQIASQKADELSAIEKKILHEFLADYRYETERQLTEPDSISAPFYQKNYFRQATANLFSRQDAVEENHLLIYESGETFFWFDIGVRGRMDWKENHQKQMFSDRYLLRGALSKSLTFHTYFARFMKNGNPAFTEPYEEEIGNFSMVQPGGTVTFDILQTSLVFHQKYFNIGLYRQPVAWGASGTNNLILSKSAPLFSYIGFDTKFKGIKLSMIHGSLLNDSTHYRDIAFQQRNRSKYIAAHRLDIPFFRGTTTVGFSEMVIYGDRGIDIAYMTPFGLYWPIGHSLEDRDNTLMAVDFKTTFIRNITFYGSVLIDEMRFSELGKQWWANKHAWQAGMRWSPNIATLPFDFQAEFTAVRPWTYSHKTLTTNYTHNSICLGFPYGANSQTWYFKIGTALSRRLTLTSEYLILKKGVDDSTHFWGGDATVSYELRDEQYDHATKWLMGDIETTNQLKVAGRYEIFNDFFIKAGINLYNTKLNNDQESYRFGFIETEINF